MNDFICIKYKRWQNYCVRIQNAGYLGENRSMVIHRGRGGSFLGAGHLPSPDLRCESPTECTLWWSIELFIFELFIILSYFLFSLSVFFIRKRGFFFKRNSANNWICYRYWGIHTYRTSWKKLLNVSWIQTSTPRLNFHWQCHYTALKSAISLEGNPKDRKLC